MKSQELNFPDLEKIVWRKSRPGKEFCGAVPLLITHTHNYALFMPPGGLSCLKKISGSF